MAETTTTCPPGARCARHAALGARAIPDGSDPCGHLTANDANAIAEAAREVAAEYANGEPLRESTFRGLVVAAVALGGRVVELEAERDEARVQAAAHAANDEGARMDLNTYRAAARALSDAYARGGDWPAPVATFLDAVRGLGS